MAKLRVDKIAAPIIKDEFTGSVFFDGNGDHLDVPLSDDFQFGAGDFNIEAWVYLVEAKDQSIFGTNNSANPNYEGYELDVFTNGSVRFYSGNGSAYNYGALGLESSAGVVPQQTWTHLAISREGNTLRLFVNGVLSVSNTSFSHTIENSAVAPDIGNDGRSTGTSYHTHGYISNLRVCKGHAVYTGNFTVPTRELEVHTGAKGVVFPAADNRTVLLACQDAYNPTTEATERHKITGSGHLSGDFGKNIVTNGDFTDGTTGWTGLSGATLSVENGKLKITESTGAADGYAVNGTAITTVVGVKYKIEWTFTEGTNTSFTVRFGKSGNQTQEYQSNSAAGGTFNNGGTYSFYFTATGTQLNLSFIVNQASTYGYVSNVSVVAIAPISEANPGLLRKTNTTSTITETTGSVYFDNSGDYLVPPVDDDELILGDTYSVEWWHNLNEVGTGNKRDGFIMAASGENSNTNESGGLGIYAESSGSTQYIRVRANNTGSDVSTPAGSVLAGVWQHCAVQVNRNYCEIYIDGVLRASGNTNGSVTQRIRRIGSVYFLGDAQNSDYATHGYISNLRICKGHVVYTSQFIPPTRELEAHTGSVDDRTVLLCCYDGENIFAEKTGRILRAVGDRKSSPTPTATDSPIGSTAVTPGLTREVDPVEGPTFGGGAGFVSQNWLTLPKGTTAERDPKLSNAVSHGSARGIFGAIQVYPNSSVTIHYSTIATFGNTVDFGDLNESRRYAAGCSSKTRGLFGGGSEAAPGPAKRDSIDYITIATTGNAFDFGDLTQARWSPSAFSNATRGIWFSGNTSPANTNVIDYVTISTLGDALDFGDAFSSRRYCAGSTSDTTRGIDAGGHPASDNVIQYITFASTGNALDFGDLTQGVDGGCGGVSNGTRGVFAGGYTPTQINTIQYITIQSMGNSKDFGDMTSTNARHGAAAESSVRGLFTHGGYPSRLNTIDAITIATTGNAVEFGDIIDIGGNDGGGDSGTQSGFSNGHGGLG